MAKRHRAPDRRSSRLRQEHGAGAGERSHQARRDGVGGNRRHRVLVDRRKRRSHSRRRGQSKRQQIYRQFEDLSQSEQKQAWLILVRFLQERYGIPSENIYAHNWIDFKDRRYCEGCELATLARKLGYEPNKTAS